MQFCSKTEDWMYPTGLWTECISQVCGLKSPEQYVDLVSGISVLTGISGWIYGKLCLLVMKPIHSTREPQQYHKCRTSTKMLQKKQYCTSLNYAVTEKLLQYTVPTRFACEFLLVIALSVVNINAYRQNRHTSHFCSQLFTSKPLLHSVIWKHTPVNNKYWLHKLFTDIYVMVTNHAVVTEINVLISASRESIITRFQILRNNVKLAPITGTIGPHQKSLYT